MRLYLKGYDSPDTDMPLADNSYETPTNSGLKLYLKTPAYQPPKHPQIQSTGASKPQGITTPPTAKTPSTGLQTANRMGNILPPTDSPESFVKGLNAVTEQYQPTRGTEFTQYLSDMATRSTARKNRQTGLQFQTLLGQTSKGGVKANASPTSAAWFGVMTDDEKTRAASIRNPVERGKFINGLGLNTRAVDNLHGEQNKAAEYFEHNILNAARKTESSEGRLIATWATGNNQYSARDYQGTDPGAVPEEMRFLSDKQRQTIGAYAQIGDFKSVVDYYNSIKPELLSSAREELIEQNRTLGYEHPVYSIVLEGTYNAFGGIPAIVDTAMKKLGETITRKWTPIDPNSHVYDFAASSQAIQEGANERIEGQIVDGQRVGGIENEFLRGAARMGRSAASSALTNGLQLLMGGAAGLEGEALSNFTISVMSASAAGQTAYRELKKGKTSGEALSNAIATFTVESITEKVSLDRFIRELPNLKADNAKQLAINFWNMVKVQAPIEGLEEVTANFLDQMWDISYSGEDSEYSRRSQAVLAQKILNSGDPEHYKPTQEDVQAAREQAFMDLFITQSAEAFATAVLSSFLMVGAPTASNAVDIARTRHVDVRAGNQLKRTGVGAVLDEINKGLLLTGTETAQFAESLDKQIDRTSVESVRKLSSKDIGKLERLNTFAVFRALGEMSESENTDVQNFARDIAQEFARDQRLLLSRNLNYEKFRRLIEVRDNNALEEAVSTQAEPAPIQEPTPVSAPEPEFAPVPEPIPVDSETGRQQFPYMNDYLDSREQQAQAAEPVPVAEPMPVPMPEPAPVETPAIETPKAQTETPSQPEVDKNRGTSEVAPNQYIDYHWAVIPAESLNISHDEYGVQNPNYPKELQPRDRTRVFSQNDISRIAKTIDPIAMTKRENVREGAPLVNHDGVVISGNGRSAAIRAAYQNQYESGSAYENYIRNHAGDFGLDAAQFPEHPILVRVADNVTNEAQLARDSNVTQQTSLSATEQAQLDAENIESILELLKPTENGDISNAENRDFIAAFIASAPQSEQAALLDEYGEFSASGLQRAKNAIVAYVYNDMNLLKRFTESARPDMKAITNGLVQAAPKLSQLKLDMQSGDAYNMPVIQTILDGLELYAESKRNRQTVHETADQAPLDTQYDANSVLVGEIIEYYKMSAVGLRYFLTNLANAVRDFGAPNQLSLLGGSENATIESALDTAAARANEREKGKSDFQRREGQFGRQSVSGTETPGSGIQSEQRPDVGGDSTGVTENAGEGVSSSLAMDNRNPTITEAMPQEAQETQENPLPEGVGAASYAFNNDAIAAQLEYNAARYGTIDGQEKIDERGRVDNVYINEIPAKMNDETYVGRNVANQMSALGIAKERISDYEEGVVNGYFNENPLTHKDMLDKADATMKRLGVEGSRKYLVKTMEQFRPLSLEDIALFQKTLVQLSHTDMSTQDYIEFAAEFSHYASYLGHGLNLLKLLREIDPNYELNELVRIQDNLNRDIAEKGQSKARNKNLPDFNQAEEAVETARNEVLDDMQHPEKANRRHRRRQNPRQQAGEAADVARDHGFPVPHWMDDAGKIIADILNKKADKAMDTASKTPRERRVVQTVMQDILKFADNYGIPQAPKTPSQSRDYTDRVRDFFANHEKYQEAWKSAQDTLRTRYERDGNAERLAALDRFINGTLDVEGILEPRLKTDINAALREIGVKMSDIIREGNSKKEAVAKRIADMLIEQYGISEEAAQEAGQIVVDNFNQQVQERSQETLKKMFQEKAKSGKLTKNQDRILKQFSDLANLGAFSSSDYAELAAAKIFGYNYIRINQDLIDEFRNTDVEDEKARDEIISRIQQDIANQIEPTLYEKYVALQYLGMLGSLKTIFSRNMGGNLGFQPIVGMKNAIAAGLESGAKALGIKIEKTRTVTYRKGDYDAWFEDFGSIKPGEASKVRKLILQGGKYADNRSTNDFMRGIEDKRTIFGRNNDIISKSIGKGLEWSRRAVTDFMDWGDALFARHTYAATAARYLKAQGVTFDTASDAQKDAAREIAVREAAEATYRDNNQFAEAISRFGRSSDDRPAFKAISFLTQGILPFRKTPANIAVRAVEYSPLGVFKTLYDTTTKQFGANKITGNDLINEWAKLLTGTGLFLLGAFLKRWGMFGRMYVTGTGALEKQKKRGFMRLQGWKEYSLKFKIGNKWRYYNADWLAPEAIPVFLGANFAESMEESGLSFWDGAKVAMTVADPLINMSVLSGLNNAIDEAATYGADNEFAFMNIITNAMWSNFTQAAVPQIAKQIPAMFDNTRNKTFIDRNTDMPSGLQRKLGSVPYLPRPRIDYIDEWGRTQENYETAAGNAVAQILSPAYQSIQEIDSDVSRTENELLSLYDRTQEPGVLPTTANSYFELNGQRHDMTQAEYISYATQRGQTALMLTQQLTESSAYKTLNDSQRIAAVKGVYDYANQMAKASIWGEADNPEQRFTPDSWVDKANALTQSGIAVHEYIIAKAIDSRATSATIKDSNGDSVKSKVKYQKWENGKSSAKTSDISSASVQAALEIRQSIRFSGNDAQKKYKLLFSNLGIAESVHSKSEQWLEKKLDDMRKKGSTAP